MSATEVGDPHKSEPGNPGPQDPDARNAHNDDPGDTEPTNPERGGGEPERPDDETRAAQPSGVTWLPPAGLFTDPLAWRPVKAPSLVDLEMLARQVYAGLPDRFRSLCEDLVIQVDDFASEEVLDDMEIESPFDLMGLFQGVGLPFRSESAFHMPNMIWLYRRSILDYWAEHDETLGAIVTHVLVHEIGHHFGLSDDDMEEIEAAAG
jgi:predicted Zn-dependent protease with MMP-like domain